ncbi:MAG: hypothetical protein H7Z75_08815 [Ferruginibacter sp.]|nr:hypothetical protein [Cytophagales bacterium]
MADDAMELVQDESLRPRIRRLTGYAYDPSLSTSLDGASINLATFKIRWEADLQPGPIGEYLEVIDVDPASQAFYLPVDLNNPMILAQDGLPPSESNPQFHQQMVYAVAMLTIQHFERALGRKTLWSPFAYQSSTDSCRPPADGPRESSIEGTTKPDRFVKRLRIYPHALRTANAYYSPDKKAVLFGYFPARPQKETSLMPGSLVFTALSHDIIAHEVTHALIDGLRHRFIYAYHPDTKALHEAFSDLVALCQHFTFKEALTYQIAKTRGELDSEHLLGQLAQQFGLAIGNYSSLRDAIGKVDKETGHWRLNEPNANDYKQEMEPHRRGSILVAAVFGAFLNVYRKRVADLFRIATDGTGVLRPGNIHPDLVERLATEAARTAKHFLSVIIRALDYCPPAHTTFGDLLRAMITADLDLVPNDPLGYRVALMESFKRWGIYPEQIRTLSEDSLIYPTFTAQEWVDILGKGNTPEEKTGDRFVVSLSKFLRHFFNEVGDNLSRSEIFQKTLELKGALHTLIEKADFHYRSGLEQMTGVLLTNEKAKDNQVILPLSSDWSGKYRAFVMLGKNDCPRFQVHSMHRSQRVGPDNVILNQVILTITQNCCIEQKDLPENHPRRFITFQSGCTLILDMDKRTVKVMKKRTLNIERLEGFLGRLTMTELTASDFPFHAPFPLQQEEEPFAALHGIS